MSERKLHDRNHELALLNCVFIDRSIIPNVSRMVQEADFSDSFNQLVYRKILELDMKGGADYISLNTETGGRNPAMIASLNDHVPTASNWEYYAKSVKRYSILRNALALAQNVLSATVDTIEKEIDTFLTKGAELMDVSGGAAVKPIREIIPAVIERIEKAYARRENSPEYRPALTLSIELSTGTRMTLSSSALDPAWGKLRLL